MSTFYRLPGGVEVTRWWARGSYRWTLNTETLDAGQIAALFALLDPVVGEALLREIRQSGGSISDPADPASTESDPEKKV